MKPAHRKSVQYRLGMLPRSTGKIEKTYRLQTYVTVILSELDSLDANIYEIENAVKDVLQMPSVCISNPPRMA